LTVNLIKNFAGGTLVARHTNAAKMPQRKRKLRENITLNLRVIVIDHFKCTIHHSTASTK
jgi:hypothetical protein